jgi:acyl-CoA thioester hydrolase
MNYKKTFTVKPEHIDCQGIMDGLFYPYYMEKTRHAFCEDTFKVDLKGMAEEGINWIITEYTIKFKKSLTTDDEFEVDCYAELISPIKVKFEQKMIKDGKVVTTGTFITTMVNTSGGRPFILDEVKEKIEETNKGE